MKGKRVSDDFASAIYSAKNKGFSVRKIATILNSNRRTVSQVLARRIAGTNLQRKLHRGRRRSLSKVTERRLITHLKRNRFQSFRSAAT